MKLGGVLAAVWPAPRRSRGWRDRLPPYLLGGAFLAACALLAGLDRVAFTDRRPFALVVLLPWIWRLHLAQRAGLTRGRSALAATFRSLLVLVAILALAEPRTVRRDDRLAIVFAVDHSASIAPRAGEEALRFVLAAAADKPPRDDAGLVLFGRNAAVELPPRPSLPFEAINVAIDRDGTDLARALSLGAALLPPDRDGRVVLVSDGVATEGDLDRTLDELARTGVPADVLAVRYGYEHEVWLEALDLPRMTKIGETYEASIVLSSLQAGRGRLRLVEDGQVVSDGSIEFAAGKSRFTVPIRLRAAGYHEYAAHVEVDAGRDSQPSNNVAMAHVEVAGKGRILVVRDPEGVGPDVAPLVDALRETGREVDEVAALALPPDPLALLPYDCIVLFDVPRDAVGEAQMRAIHDAVHEQGSGLLMAGGAQSFGPGGWRRTPIEDALPVSLDLSQRKVLPKGALAIVLHTCEFPEGNTWGKRITKEAMRVLDRDDEVGVLAYDYQGGERWLFPLTPAGDYERLAALVNAAQIGDMPSFATTMQMGLAGLVASDAAARHMIVISDGDPSPPPPALLASFAGANVSVSTVAVFPHGNDTATMEAIARATGGRYYRPSDPGQLPAIFVKEAKTLQRGAVQNKTFRPQVQAPSGILKGLDALPELGGYVLTMPKPRSLTVLEGPEPEEPDPVLATWRYGTGAAAAFTSVLGPGWGGQWLRWPGFRPFVHQLVTEIARAERPARLLARAHAAGQQGVLVVEDHGEAEELLDLTARVRAPRGDILSLGLLPVAPRRYEARFPLGSTGRYHLTVAGGSGSGVERAHAGFVVAYSPEYLRFRSDPLALRRVAERTQGRVLEGHETGRDLYGLRRPRLVSRPLFGLLLVLLACLLPLDVALRRVHVDLGALWALVRGRRAAAEATIGTLLARKQSGEAEREARRVAEPPASSAAERRSAPPVRQPPAPRKSAAASGGSEAAPGATPSLQERLLAAKRRALPPKGRPGGGSSESSASEEDQP